MQKSNFFFVIIFSCVIITIAIKVALCTTGDFSSSSSLSGTAIDEDISRVVIFPVTGHFALGMATEIG
jgi:hypothetical protein